MKIRNIIGLASIAALVFLLGLSLPTASFAGGDSDSDATPKVFTNKFLNKYCRKAQKKVAQTSLRADVVIFSDIGSPGVPFPPPGIPATGFIGSDAAPWDGNESADLSVTQYVGYGETANGDDYAQTVMCKMKSAEALNFYYPGSATEGNDCSDVNRRIVNKVLNSLYDDDDSDSDGAVVIPTVVYETWVSFTGQQWTSEAPATTAYTSTDDGLLHIVGKQLFVERTNPSPFVGPEKKGVHYCQTIAPEYVRKLLTGAVAAPTCAAPPAYAPPAGPPGPVPQWGCPNP